MAAHRARRRRSGPRPLAVARRPGLHRSPRGPPTSPATPTERADVRRRAPASVLDARRSVADRDLLRRGRRADVVRARRRRRHGLRAGDRAERRLLRRRRPRGRRACSATTPRRCSRSERLDAALHAAERATRSSTTSRDPSDDRIDPIRVNLAAVLIGANQDDEALAPARDRARQQRARLGETNTDRRQHRFEPRDDLQRAAATTTARSRYLTSALAIEREAARRATTSRSPACCSTSPASYRYKHDYPASIAAARRAAQIFGAKSPGSDRHRIALTMAALGAPTRPTTSRRRSSSPRPRSASPGPPRARRPSAWAQLERARALIGLDRAGEARPLLVDRARRYAGLNMTQRVQQIDDLRALS